MKFVGLILGFLFLGSSVAQAQLDDEAPAAVPAAGESSKAKRRAYPGGRDEEDLQVQTSLAQPTRNPDASAVVQPKVGSGGTEEPAAQD